MSKKREEFRNFYRTITELGVQYGMSAVKFGKVLKEYGLRDDNGNATRDAMREQIAFKVTPKNGRCYFLYHIIKTRDFLERNGFESETSLSRKEADRKLKAKKLGDRIVEAQALADKGKDRMAFMTIKGVEDEIKTENLYAEVEAYLKSKLRKKDLA